jgi:RNA-directed DNA polymerase
MMTAEAEGRFETAAASPEGSGRNLQEKGAGASNISAKKEHSLQGNQRLMEAVVERENMKRAYHRVFANKGSAGVDGMAVGDLRGYLVENWLCIKEELLSGQYQPRPVLGVEIPKPGGKGMRQLGIPTVLDRLIQQALNQVLQPIFDPGFSESSYGFRPGRSAHQAVKKAREYVSENRRWVVDMDLEKFLETFSYYTPFMTGC